MLDPKGKKYKSELPNWIKANSPLALILLDSFEFDMNEAGLVVWGSVNLVIGALEDP